jgi:YD repeat-containing protein
MRFICARLLLAAVVILGSTAVAAAHIDRARQTFTYGAVNAANEYASIDGDALTYDAAGNLTVDEDGRQYFYDQFSRLTEVQDSGNAVLVRYAYDALGRRVLSEFSPNDPPNAYSIRYVYDGQRIIEERDGADAVLRRYTWGLDVAGLAGTMNSLAAAGGIGGLLAVTAAWP